ncbi:MAG: protein translocase subunit SecF, partial [Candidatus Aenigmatarchaeota archaeon]
MEGEGSKRYRLFLVVPVILLVFSVVVLVNGYIQTGEWFIRSIELKGGTLITINTKTPVDIDNLKEGLVGFGDVSVRELRGFAGYGVMIGMEADVDSLEVLGVLGELGVNTADSSTATIGPALGASFWQQAQTAVIAAFIFMGIIVFAIFRASVPSFAVMLAALSDIIITLALMQVFGVELSLAGLAALLMLLGYSVDTDLMLTTRLLKGTGLIIERLKGALKTGLTMSLTTIGVLAALLFSAISPVLSQIAAVLLI